ncbi:MAG: DUF4065 domain-containing protein [Nitrosopumilus sp.]|nr:DUF4065 domain-containing protein [Nitrosopumilus sp.]CAI9831959.1 hypothetical protein IBTHAUMO2_510009 [Nitrosopumilaceae archaeon]MDA7941740.1 DUF4065 domain-containing protein [Nitrosopumilus sp.]MDA7943725.1 DUF4065 domain-containing protein [Nitrosopumilus sp.]MDA7945786.1 DUF4065 domain-containing protein [Nitrosopumilus sp.]
MAQAVEQDWNETVSAMLVGDYITALGRGRFTPLQVLKLAYLSHGYTLAITGKPLFSDMVVAGKLGPTIPTLDYAIREHGGAAIPRLYSCGTPVISPDIGRRIEELGGQFTPNNRAIVDQMVRTFGKYEGADLASHLNKDGTPWSETIKASGEDSRIEDARLEAYFKKELEV